MTATPRGIATATSPHGAEGASLLRLENVEKTFGKEGAAAWALRRITLDVRRGEFLSIMGPSGAGKTTLLHVLGLHDCDWSGGYWFDGKPVHEMKHKERGELRNQNIGFVFQQYHLIDDLTVYENIEMPLTYRNVARHERAGIVADALDRFHIVGKKDLFPRQLSGGQQQLVGIARAVIAKPALILADEPTGNLHSDQGREIMEMFVRLNQSGTTIIQVTHSDVNAAFGHRTLRLSDGWIENPSAHVPRSAALGDPGVRRA